MAMPVHPLDGAFERINRAEKHLADLKGMVETFGKDYLDAVDIELHSEPPHYPHQKWPPPPSRRPQPLISILIGEICYNLRSALDYLVYELAILDSGTIQDGTQFPIDNTPQKFSGHKRSMLKGLSLKHIAAIEGLQPYSGIAWTKILRDISNQ